MHSNIEFLPYLNKKSGCVLYLGVYYTWKITVIELNQRTIQQCVVTLTDPGRVLLRRLGRAQGSEERPELLRHRGDLRVYPVSREEEVQLGGDQSGGTDTLHCTHVHGGQQEDTAHWRRVSSEITVI